MKTLLIKNGRIVTMNPERKIFTGDILIKNDIIELVEDNIEIETDEIIDASGCAVIPGFIQTHIHLTQRLFQGLADDLELLEWLKKRIWPREAKHTYETNYISAKLGIAELISCGTTSIVDMGTVNHTEAIFEAIKETDFRALAGKCMMDYGKDVPAGLMEDTRSSIEESEKLIRKWHKSAEGRIEYAFAPRFVISCTEKLLLKIVDMAKDMNLMIHTHASENREEISIVEQERGMRNINYLKKLGMTGKNLILAHCIWLDEEEKKILADSGTKIAHCPSSNLKLASGIAPIPELLNIGCNVSIGTDGSPANNNLNIFTEMRHAALIQKARLLDPTVMPAETVFEMATLGGAIAMGKENELGSIEKGKKADIAVIELNTVHNSPDLGRNIIGQIVYSANASDVITTIINGKVVMKDKKLLTIDIEQVIADAGRISVTIV